MNTLNQFERLIESEYGKMGVSVYRLIDGKRTAEQIMSEARVDENTITGLFEFLEERGLIRLVYKKHTYGHTHASSTRP